MAHGALRRGPNHPLVKEAVAQQLERGTHYGASHELESQWAERVGKLIPSAEVGRFTGSGTEATMMAIRLARAFTGRKTLLRFQQHFHGWNDNMVGAPDREGVHPHALGIPDETLSNVVVIPQNAPDMLLQTLRDEEVAAVLRGRFLPPLGGLHRVFGEVAGWHLFPGQRPLDQDHLAGACRQFERAGIALLGQLRG